MGSSPARCRYDTVQKKLAGTSHFAELSRTAGELNPEDFVTLNRILGEVKYGAGPDTLREEVEQQLRAERESEPWLRDVREATSARERLAKLEAVKDNYRDQQAEGLITMAKLREKLYGVRAERGGLRTRLALLANGERTLRELEELPLLVEEYLKDLPYLMDRMLVIREY